VRVASIADAFRSRDAAVIIVIINICHGQPAVMILGFSGSLRCLYYFMLVTVTHFGK
jgi:hypothetical protein